MNSVPFSGQLGSAEVRVLAKRIAKRQTGIRLSTLMMSAGPACFVLAAIQASADNSDGALQWFMFGFIIGSLGIGLRWSEGRAARRSLKAQEINGFVIDDGVQLVAADSETLFRWSSFAALEVVGDLLILWLASGSALALSPVLFPDETGYRRARAIAVEALERRQ